MTGSERIAEYARTAREAVPDRKVAVAMLRLAGRSVEGWASAAGRAAFAEAVGRIVSLSDDRPVDAETIQAVEAAKRVVVAEFELDPTHWAQQLMDFGTMGSLHALVMSRLLEWSGPSTRAMFAQTADDTPVVWRGGDASEKGGSDA